MELSKGQRDLAAIQESDRAELREILQNISNSVEELRALQRTPAPAVADIMQSIEEVRILPHASNESATYCLFQELDDPRLEAQQQRDLQQNLIHIRQHAPAHPPMTDRKPNHTDIRYSHILRIL